MPTAIVTGASRGIGRAIALHLVQMGWNVGLLARSAAALEEVAAEGRSLAEQAADGGAGRVAWVALDIANWSEVEGAALALAHQLGTPSLLVNNAGVIDNEVPIWESDPQQLEATVRTNLLGALLAERAFLPQFVSGGGGRVINLASGAGAKSWPIMPAYTTTKAALIRNVGDLAQAGERTRIRAFALAPGVVATQMTAGMNTHRGRTDFTPVERTLALVEAIAQGRLDAWSGAYLRADVDEVSDLEERSPIRGPRDRSFGVFPWGEDDPVS